MIFSIWVDADSVPVNLRAIILKAAIRLRVCAVFVSDRSLKDVLNFIAEDTYRIRSDYLKKKGQAELSKEEKSGLKSKIEHIKVPTGENSADNYIAEHSNAGDLCITHDIPLAARLLEKDCFVIDDRGGEFTKDSIKSRLMDRSVNAELRSWGIFADLQKKSVAKDVKSFSDTLDRVTRALVKLC